MNRLAAAHKPDVEFRAVVAGGAGREVVLGDALPGGDLLECLNRLAAEVPGGLCYRPARLAGGTLGPAESFCRTVG